MQPKRGLEQVWGGGVAEGGLQPQKPPKKTMQKFVTLSNYF
tara:strand:+ start:1114 stop:1236 length:123 start_codon:yes stop_codon:yes gene_type:complete